MTDVYVLDAYAVLAYLFAESGGRRVKELLLDAVNGRARVLLGLISYGEAIYTVQRRRGERGARELIRQVEDLPVEQVEVTRELVFAAASIKADQRLSYADAFAVALARREGAALVTGDPELRAVEHLVPLEWVGP